jgi:prepilin-type N-terminal cleavage/methylation domain-containing protein
LKVTGWKLMKKCITSKRNSIFPLEMAGVRVSHLLEKNLLNNNSKVPSPQPSPRWKESYAAFTLIELSIVLVIMGLLVAATMAGKELLNSARLRSVISEIESYKIAVDNFKTQYEALPGDIKNASSFWTTAQNGGTTVKNGDGNGKIGTAVYADYVEPYYLWNHLTLSKFVQGTFSGTSAAAATIGVNIPGSKYVNGMGYAIYTFNPFGFSSLSGKPYYSTYLVVGKDGYPGENYPSIAVLSAVDTYYIDNKIDDGKPNYGNMLSDDGNSGGNCRTGATPDEYDLTRYSTANCIFVVNIQ